ncbi:hypothetical protein TNCV_2641921 [Trichonephila clavipes]|nr:hypothetical protein TNCV_2641921 [Trichonephila clavipes]
MKWTILCVDKLYIISNCSLRLRQDNNKRSPTPSDRLHAFVGTTECFFPEKLTVWCALWAGGILLQNDEGHNVTVNGDRYRAMITNFFIPELNNHDVQELWFQQDGATCHTARATID